MDWLAVIVLFGLFFLQLALGIPIAVSIGPVLSGLHSDLSAF